MTTSVGPEWVFRVFGPLSATGPRGKVTLRSARERTLLATLIIKANRSVPIDQLIDSIWGTNAPRTARSQVHACVSSLRQRLDRVGLRARIITRPTGYELTVRPDELDLEAFEAAVATASDRLRAHLSVAAVRDLRQAVDIAAGEPFADVDSEPVRRFAARPVERRVRAVETYVAAEIELDRHQEVLDDLLALIGEHPLRERVRLLHILALHGSGRRSEALEAYHAARRVLVDRLGIEPGAPMRELYEKILAEEDHFPPAPAARPASLPEIVVPHLLPPPVGDFTGRREPQDAILSLLRRGSRPTGAGPRGTVIVISGPPGVGKTSLAAQTAHRFTEEFDGGQLFADLGDEPPGAAPHRVILRFLSALGMPTDEREGADGNLARYRNALAGRRAVVLLDGVRDEEQVLPLLPGSPGCLVIITSRFRLGGLPGAERIHLEPPGPAEAAGMLSAMLDNERVADDPAVADLVALCDRLPLALRAVAGKLNGRPHWDLAQAAARLRDPRRRLDELSYGGVDMRASILRGYETLPPAPKDLFGKLALYEPARFPVWLASALLDSDGDECEDHLHALLDVQLVEAVWADGEVSYRMTPLVRLVARERLAEIPEAKRVSALRRVVEAWAQLAEQVLGAAPDAAWPVNRPAQPGPAESARLPSPGIWLQRHRPELLWVIEEAQRSGADDVGCELESLLRLSRSPWNFGGGPM